MEVYGEGCFCVCGFVAVDGVLGCWLGLGAVTVLVHGC